MRSDVLRGHIDSIVLSLLATKDSYGYEISKEIARKTDGRFEVKEATLYAVFQRMEKKELIVSYYGARSHGGKRKYYSITTLGKAYLREITVEWNELKSVIDLFLKGV